jgi:DNA (cytosine-5)-methyltransferase 1
MLSELDIITGGFPCQDISVAGAGAGLGGKRSGLFFEIIRLTRACRPRFVFLENVPAISIRGLDRVLLEFTQIGYDCRWTTLSAAEVGAPHLRARWFLLAHSNDDRRWMEPNGFPEFNAAAIPRIYGETLHVADSDRLREPPNPERGNGSRHRAEHCGQEMANANGEGLEGSRRKEELPRPSAGNRWWSTEPDVGRVVDGLPHRIDRIRCLGNSVVPQQVREAFNRLVN